MDVYMGTAPAQRNEWNPAAVSALWKREERQR